MRNGANTSDAPDDPTFIRSLAIRRLRRNFWRYFKSIFSRTDVIHTEGVSYLDFFAVGETSGLDASLVGETSGSRCNTVSGQGCPSYLSRFFRSAGPLGCHTRIRAGFPRDGSRPVFFIVARGPVPRDLHRHDVFFPSVVCDRLITNRSGSGDPDLQG